MKKQIASMVALAAATLSAYPITLSGWLLYSDSHSDVGLCEFDSEDSRSSLQVVKAWTGEGSPTAGAYVGDKYYLLMGNGSSYTLGTYDSQSGAFTGVKEYGNISPFRDMASDGRTLYAVDINESEDHSYLYTINPTDGEYTTAPLTYSYYCLACDPATGVLYGVEYNGTLVAIDPQSGEEKEINYLDYYPVDKPQSMFYSTEDEMLYWASYSERASYFLTISPMDGTLIDEQDMGAHNEAEIVGLGVKGAAAATGMPAAVSDFTVTAGDNGILEAKLAWVNPSTTAEGVKLDALNDAIITRNGEVVATIAANAAGASQTYADHPATAGVYTYGIAVTNAAGESRAVSSQPCWIGADAPKAPANLKASANGLDIALSWDAVTEGSNGGYIDPALISYKVTRNPGNTVVDENVAGTELTDKVGGMNVYTYTVTTLYDGADSGQSSSATVKAGSVIAPPYLCDFSSSAMMDTWSQIDGNGDGLGWEAYPSLKYAYYTANFDEQIDADDYLVSAPIKLEAGKRYRLSFDIMSESDYPEVLEVRFGSEPTASGLSETVARYEYCEPTWAGKSEFLPEIGADGEYYVAFRAASHWDSYNIYVRDVAIEEVQEGTVWGSVTDESGAAVADAKVAVGDLEGSTGADGSYAIIGVPSGNYTVTISKYGYEDFTSQEIAVGLGDSKEVSAVLKARAAHKLAGKVTNHAGTPVADAKVSITGYENRTAKTDESGAFTFDNLYVGEYTLTAHYYALDDATKAINLDADADLGAIMLEDKTLSPAHVDAQMTNGKMTISWEAPVDALEYRHDNGIEGGQIGRGDATAKSVFGTIFREPTTLTSMTWYTNQQYETHQTVNVFVFGLDENGQPEAEPILKKENVANTDGEWSTYEFPSPIDAPNGYLIGLSFEGNLCLGLDKQDGSEEYPFVEGTNCFTMDYTSGGWEYIEKHDITRSMMIRAGGYALGEAAMPEMTTKREYYVIRYSQDGDEEWSDPIDGTEYVDAGWNALPMGKYRYGVSSVFESGVESEPAMTAWMEKEMTTNVTLRLKTNTPVNEASGAAVAMTPAGSSNAKALTAVADDNGEVSFKDVPKGKYSVKITRKGFNEFAAEADFSTENDYVVDSYVLNEYIVDPYNLSVKDQGDGNYVLQWNYTNYISDDFEGHSDFAINSAGALGWEYIDNDNAPTEPIEGLDFPGNGDEMAFMVFNPSALGVIDPAAAPHSGDKYLATLPAKTYENDDYLISPVLDHDTEFTFSFWAKSYDDTYGLEALNAGYFTDEAAPDSFVRLNENVEEVPTEWTKYTYTVPAEAKRVAVQCVSEYQFLFMLDDIFAGVSAPEGIDPENVRPDVTYTVYVDGKELTSGPQTSATISGLSDGEHTLGVKAHFASGDSQLVETRLTALSGIVGAEIDTDGEAEYYNLTGMRIHNLQPGTICIERRGSSVRKIIVK